MADDANRSCAKLRWIPPRRALGSTFARSLAIAAAVHGAFILQICWRRSHTHARTNQHHEVRVELDLERSSSQNTPGELSSIIGQPLTSPVGSQRRSRQAAEAATPAKPLIPETVAQPTASSSGEVVAHTETSVSESNPAVASHVQPKINLGLNGGLLRILEAHDLAHPQKNAGRSVPVDPGADLRRNLAQTALADDLRHGHARGNVLVGALDSAVRQMGPTRGQATLRATVNAQGEVTGVELVNGDVREWLAVLGDFRRQVRNRRVRVPTGANGLLITFAVSAKVQRPSGKEVEAGPTGMVDPSVAWGGLGLTQTFDLADLSNKSARMLAVRVIREELL